MITTTTPYLPMDMPLQLLLQLPPGLENELLDTLTPRRPCLCLVLDCVSGAVRLVLKLVIQACF